MKIAGAVPLECGIVILTARAGNCASAGEAAASRQTTRRRRITRP
jgi:hypothetical protein